MFKNFFYPQGIDEEGEFLPFLSINDEEEELDQKEDFPKTIPILALKNTVLFPGIVIPITVGRDKSIKAVHKAYESGKMVGGLVSKNSKDRKPD